MFLAVDAGNTNVTLGLFPARNGREVSFAPLALWRLPSRRDATADGLAAQVLALFQAAGFSPRDVTGVAVASVVPPLDSVFQRLFSHYFGVKPLFITPEVDTGIRLLCDNPMEVGADRIVNAVAAHRRVQGPCLVVDFGTATTFDCVSRRGDYIGGAIAPGPLTAAQALARNTAKLPLVDPFQPPPSPLGKNTLDCLRSGLYYGYLGLVRELLGRLKPLLGKGSPRILATGGLAALFAPALREVHEVVPDLTLQGIALVWERNDK